MSERFGRFRLLERLAGGGMATVSRAVVDGPHGFQRQLVIKRIQPALVSPSFVHLLATEARVSARLHHPGIVQVYEFGCIDGEYYLAMELVDGLDLHRLKRLCQQQQRRIPLGVACFVIREVAAALAYAHALTDGQGRPLGIVHRDVSPSNVMVSPLGAVKLCDFGIAKAADHVRTDQTPTQVGWLRGKINYVSPEQAMGKPLDARSDVFSLGIVLHELITMQRLFAGATAFETLRRIRDVDVPAPSRGAPGVPPALDAVVARMLARKPEERFASCDELVAALTPLVRRLDGDMTALTQLVAELGVKAHLPAEASEAPPATPTHPTPTLALADLPPSLPSIEDATIPSWRAVSLGSSSAAPREPVTRPSALSLARRHSPAHAAWTLVSFVAAFVIGLGVNVARQPPVSSRALPVTALAQLPSVPSRELPLPPSRELPSSSSPRPSRSPSLDQASPPIALVEPAPTTRVTMLHTPSLTTPRRPTRTHRRDAVIVDPYR